MLFALYSYYKQFLNILPSSVHIHSKLESKSWNCTALLFRKITETMPLLCCLSRMMYGITVIRCVKSNLCKCLCCSLFGTFCRNVVGTMVKRRTWFLGMLYVVKRQKATTTTPPRKSSSSTTLGRVSTTYYPLSFCRAICWRRHWLTLSCLMMMRLPQNCRIRLSSPSVCSTGNVNWVGRDRAKIEGNMCHLNITITTTTVGNNVESSVGVI